VIGYTGGSGASEGDLSFQFALSAGSGGNYYADYQLLSGLVGNSKWTTWTDTSHNAQTTGTANLLGIQFGGLLTTGAAPASLIFQWALNSANGTTTVKAGSFMRARRLA
jgi:hypothetical protein